MAQRCLMMVCKIIVLMEWKHGKTFGVVGGFQIGRLDGASEICFGKFSCWVALFYVLKNFRHRRYWPARLYQIHSLASSKGWVGLLLKALVKSQAFAWPSANKVGA